MLMFKIARLREPQARQFSDADIEKALVTIGVTGVLTQFRDVDVALGLIRKEVAFQKLLGRNMIGAGGENVNITEPPELPQTTPQQPTTTTTPSTEGSSSDTLVLPK